MHEHGPRGGDEINIIRERDSIREEPLLTRNYGWPIVSNGINYNGTSFTNLTSLEFSCKNFKILSKKLGSFSSLH